MDLVRGRTVGGMGYTVRGAGPPLLMMSGYVVPVAAFDQVINELAQSFMIVAIDHRGSGASSTRPWPTTTGTMAADALSVLDKLQIGSAHVVGVSLGGMVAQELAIGQPHRVRSLVLCSTIAGGAGVRTPPITRVLRELNALSRRVPGGARWRLLGTLHQTAAASSHDASRRIHRIMAPTLVLHGNEDELVPLENAAWMASRIPSAQLRIVGGGSHLLLLESAAAREALSSWLSNHRAEREMPPHTHRAQLAYLARAPHRIALGQTLPMRRTVRAVARRARVSQTSRSKVERKALHASRP